MQALTPHVYWAQRHGDIYMRVEISDAQVRKTCFGGQLYHNRQCIFIFFFLFAFIAFNMYAHPGGRLQNLKLDGVRLIFF